MIAQDGSAAHRVADTGDHTAQQIGEQEFGLAAIEFADQVPCQAVVVFVVVAGATAVIDVILHAKGVHGVLGVARGLQVVPAHQVIQAIIAEGIGEQGGAVGDRAAGHIAPGVVATAIDLPGLAGTVEVLVRFSMAR